LNMLAADGEDDPMLSPTARTLAGLAPSGNSSIDTSLVLPNTVFSSKPVNQDVGFLQLMSSGKSTTLIRSTTEPTKQVFFHIADGSGSIQRPVLKGKNVVSSFALPQTSQQTTFKPGITLSATSPTSSQTLRTLLSSSKDSKIIRMPLTKNPSPLPEYSKSSDLTTIFTTSTNVLSTTFTPSSQNNKPVFTQSFSPSTSSPSMTESFLPADISFTSESSRDSLSGLPSDAVTLSLDDLLSYAGLPAAGKPETTKVDPEPDLASPGPARSVVSEIDVTASRSDESEGGEKLTCTYPDCNKTFDRSILLKKHMKTHPGCRFVCDVCSKRLESFSKLEDHYRRHTGERPFQCFVCGNKFRYKGDRTKHLKNIHGYYKKQNQMSNGGGTTVLLSSRSDSASSPLLLVKPVDPAPSSDPLDGPASTESSGLLPSRLLSCSLPQETVTMSLDDVLQYAQPVADYTF